MNLKDPLEREQEQLRRLFHSVSSSSSYELCDYLYDCSDVDDKEIKEHLETDTDSEESIQHDIYR